jgi:hypothetical protein
MTARQHTVKLVNQATGAHPRIDLDAAIVNEVCWTVISIPPRC